MHGKNKKDTTMAKEASMMQQLEEFQGLSNLVGRFAESMRARLWEKMTVGYKGWADASRREAILTEMRDRLRVSVGEYQAGDRTKLVDIANLCAILWLHELKA